MKYYIYWSSGRYEGQNFDTFDTEKDVLAFLNAHATNTDFDFRVVEGREVKFKPVSVVQAYQKA